MSARVEDSGAEPSNTYLRWRKCDVGRGFQRQRYFLSREPQWSRWRLRRREFVGGDRGKKLRRTVQGTLAGIKGLALTRTASPDLGFFGLLMPAVDFRTLQNKHDRGVHV